MWSRASQRVALQVVVVVAVLSACAPTTPTLGAARTRCDTLGLEVTDAETGSPVTEFTVALTRESSDPVRPHFAVPLGYPVPAGDLVESIPVRSAEGMYCFERRPDAGLTIVVGSPEHEFVTIREWSDKRALQIRLQRAPRLDGRVTDSAGNPVEGAGISIARVGETPSGPPRATDAEGAFSLAPLHLPSAIDRLEIHVRHPAFRGMQQVVTRDALSSPVEIGLGERVTGGPLVGTLERPASLQRNVMIEAQCGWQSAVAEPNDDGSFRFGFLPYGPCVLKAIVLPVDRDLLARHEWNRGVTRETHVRHDGTEEVVVTTPPSATVTTRASATETGSAGCEAAMTSTSGEARRFELWSARPLRVRLAEGKWIVGGRCTSAVTSLRFETQKIDVRDGQDLDLSLALQHPTPVSVLVNGKPAHSIQLVPLDPENETSFANHDASDLQTVRGLREGLYDLVINRMFLATVAIPLPVAADIDTHALTLQIEGSEERLNGPRIEVSRVTTSDEIGYARAPHFFPLGGGEWRADSLLPGEHEIVITTPGFETEHLRVVLPANEAPRVSLVALRPPVAEPISALPDRERSVLRHVLRDVQRRVTTAFRESDEPVAIRVLSQTDAAVPLTAENWRVEDDPASAGLDRMIERFDLDGERAAIEVGPVLRECGLEPVALSELPVDRTRIGRVPTTLDLVDEMHLNQHGPPYTVLLSVTRPVFSPGGEEALVSISCAQVDFFNWVYVVRLAGDVVEIRHVLEPKPSC